MSSGFSGGGHGGGHSGMGANHSGDGGSGHHSMHIGDLQNSNILGSELQAISFSTLIEGLKVNSGVRFAVLFATFIGWLYVVYWVRHHEPLANQTIGITTIQSSTAAEDRSIVAGIKNAFPFRTCSAMGGLYCPSPKPAEGSLEANNMNQPPSQYQTGIFPEFQQAVSAQVGPGQAMSASFSEFSEQGFDQRFGSPSHQLFVNPSNQFNTSGSLVGEPLLSGYYKNISPAVARANPVLPINTVGRPSYFVQVNTSTGKLLQMVANR